MPGHAGRDAGARMSNRHGRETNRCNLLVQPGGMHVANVIMSRAERSGGAFALTIYERAGQT